MILVFTDLDGTFINHDDYRFDAALPALQRLKTAGVPVIFTSSKTQAEIKLISQEAGVQAPIIYETGCGISWPEKYFSHLPGDTHTFCQRYDSICGLLDGLRESSGYRFTAFHDLDAAGIAELTGLSHEQALLAGQRHHGEPIKWLDSEQRLNEFSQEIINAGLHLITGGRFVHVMSPSNKARAMAWLVEQYQKTEDAITTVGLGDSPNDRELLEFVDHAWLVRNLHLPGQQAKLLEIKHVHATKACGAAGWNEAINAFLDSVAT